MNYEVMGIVVVLCVVIALGIKYLPQKIKDIKLNFDLKKVLSQLKELALAFGDDKMDDIVETVYDILIDTFDYASVNLESGVVNYDELLEFVKEQVETAGLEVGEVEEQILDIACDVISSFLYNKYSN